MDWDSFLVILFVICLAGKSMGYSNVKCYAEYFNDELCPRPSTINVTSATYGLSDCQSHTGACCPKETDCEIPVTEEYLGTIKTKCNGRQTCGSSLRADWTTAIECGASGQTDYVTIHYDCLQDGTTIFPSTSRSTTVSTENTDVATDQEQFTSDGLGWGAISGISVGAFLILMILMGSGTVLIREKRNQQNKPKNKRSMNRKRRKKSALDNCHVSTINPQQLENTSPLQPSEVHDNHTYESLNHHAYTPLKFQLNATTGAMQAHFDNHGIKSVDNLRDGYLQPNKVERHGSYISVIEESEFLTRHPSAIPEAYLEVPFYGLENLSESGQQEGRCVSCHSYTEIDKPHLVVCPMPPKTSIDQAYLETEIQPVENRPGSNGAENQYEPIANEAVA